MTGDANIGNYAGEGGSDGIRPGQNGHLAFYVIPKEDGDMKLRFDLSIVPLKATNMYDPASPLEVFIHENDQDKKMVEDAEKLLRGHLLFAYYSQYEDGQPVKTSKDDHSVPQSMELANFEDGSFTIDFTQVEKNKPIFVRLVWFWPITLADAFDGKWMEAETGKFEETLPQMTPIMTDWMTGNPAYFFYNDGDTVVVPPDLPLGIAKDASLNKYYNNADKLIGETIGAIILKLNAEIVL